MGPHPPRTPLSLSPPPSVSSSAPPCSTRLPVLVPCSLFYAENLTPPPLAAFTFAIFLPRSAISVVCLHTPPNNSALCCAVLCCAAPVEGRAARYPTQDFGPDQEAEGFVPRGRRSHQAQGGALRTCGVIRYGVASYCCRLTCYNTLRRIGRGFRCSSFSCVVVA